MKFTLAAAMLAAPIAVTAATAPMTAANYVMKAGAGDQYEIQSSRLVASSTQNAKLKAFANEMVTDHTKSTADVKAAAMSAKLTPKPPMLDAMGMKNIAALKAATGTARDSLYISQQKTAHQNALALHQAYAASGTASSLKMAAGKIVPVVQHHITMLSSM